jgi:hypothetical protein
MRAFGCAVHEQRNGAYFGLRQYAGLMRGEKVREVLREPEATVVCHVL